jgi:transporter family protein
VLFAVSFLGERPAPKEWLGLALIAAGGLTLAIKR